MGKGTGKEKGGESMNEIMNIGGVDCYEKDGTAYLKLEAVARGLGFTQIAKSGNEVVRWERVRKYLEELGIPTCGDDDFIPENIFYRLAMKAKNETAERFQALVADEIIPSIRKHEAYMTPETLEQNKALQAVNSSLTVDNQIMKPKADYFDELVDRNLLTNFRETAKQLQVKEKEFIRFLLEKKFIYRDKRGKIQPYADKNNGLFEVKEFSNEKTGFASTQTLITPKGRETFRLLFLKASA